MRPRLRRSIDWLSVTPEPERLLPHAVATLRAGAPAPADAVERERHTVERLVRRGRLRDWLAYRNRALELAGGQHEAEDPRRAEAAALAVDVIANHDNLLRGLP
jgi:hypothetical protein